MRSGVCTWLVVLAVARATTGCCCEVHPTGPRAARRTRRAPPAPPSPSPPPAAAPSPPPASPAQASPAQASPAQASPAPASPTPAAPPSPAEETLRAYADELAVVADRLDAQVAEHERVYARFDPVRRVPSPAEGTALAERPSVLEVTANPMVNGLIVRALHGGHASDGRQGSVAFHERGGARVAAVCPSLLTDDPDAVDLRYERGGRTVTAAVRAPGVCEPRHRARRAGDTEAVRRRVAEHERVIFGYLRRVFAACTSGGRPALGALEALPGFVAARASCSLPGEAATRSWGDPIEPSLAADAELRGTYRPAQHRLVRWSVDPAQGLELLVARETRQDGAEAYAEIFIRTP